MYRRSPTSNLSVVAIGIAVALNAFMLAVGVALLNLIIKWGVIYIAGRAKIKTD